MGYIAALEGLVLILLLIKLFHVYIALADIKGKAAYDRLHRDKSSDGDNS